MYTLGSRRWQGHDIDTTNRWLSVQSYTNGTSPLIMGTGASRVSSAFQRWVKLPRRLPCFLRPGCRPRQGVILLNRPNACSVVSTFGFEIISEHLTEHVGLGSLAWGVETTLYKVAVDNRHLRESDQHSSHFIRLTKTHSPSFPILTSCLLFSQKPPGIWPLAMADHLP